MPRSSRRCNEFLEIGGRDDRAGRIGRTGEEHALQRLFGVRGGDVSGSEMADADRFDLDHLDAERGQDVAIGGIAGRCHGDAVADIEHREEGEVERRRRAGRHRDPLRRYDRRRSVRGSARRSPRAGGVARARRCSRCGRPASARAAASRTADRRRDPKAVRLPSKSPAWPRLFRRLASASTSMAWNGSTSPRRDSDSTIAGLPSRPKHGRAAQMPD